jgi:hypothetical protein
MLVHNTIARALSVAPFIVVAVLIRCPRAHAKVVGRWPRKSSFRGQRESRARSRQCQLRRGSIRFRSNPKVSVTLTNLGTSTKSFSLTTRAGSGGVTYSLTPSSVSLGAGASSTATITMSASKGAVSGSHQALLTVSSGGSEVAHAVVYTLVK